MHPPILLLTTPGWSTSEDGSARAWSPVAGLGPKPAHLSAEELSKTAGHWALVETDGPRAVISVDRMRSLPIVFTRVDGQWIIADDIESMRTMLPSWEADVEQARLFDHLGYAVGGKTLVAGVHSLEAGQRVTLHPDGTMTRAHYAPYARTARFSTPEEFDIAFSGALDSTIDRLLEASGERQLVVPLSGGLDSRLLLAWLVKRKAPRILAFTYGRKGSSETAISRRVAQALGVEWFSIELVPEEMRRVWASAEGAAFRKANWRGTSLPHIQDWFALRQIRERSLVDDDAIFLPGHTIVGNMHDDDRLLAPGVRAAGIAETIAHHHACAHGSPDALDGIGAFADAIRSAGREAGYDGSPESVLSWVEWFNVRERQAKYINNSMRPYEYFGFTWAAPMLDLEVWNTWLDGSVELTRDRKWYAGFTDRIYGEVTRTDAAPEYFDGASNSHGLPPRAHEALLRGMRLARLDRVLSRYRSIRRMLTHPMAFEAFAHPASPVEQAIYFASGGTSVGLWARLFLENRWGSDAKIVPERARG